MSSIHCSCPKITEEEGNSWKRPKARKLGKQWANVRKLCAIVGKSRIMRSVVTSQNWHVYEHQHFFTTSLLPVHFSFWTTKNSLWHQRISLIFRQGIRLIVLYCCSTLLIFAPCDVVIQRYKASLWRGEVYGGRYDWLIDDTYHIFSDEITYCDVWKYLSPENH